MSYNLASEKALDFDQHHSTAFDHAEQGQRHDRISPARDSDSNTPSSSNMSASSNVDEITITQRMVSASVGSILTSLLVTPLDVVRVRLQSQNPTPQPPALNLSRFPAYGANFANLPKDLGVKACCKEVFFVGDNGALCLAGNGTASTNAASLASDCAVEETERRTFNSTMDGIRKIARNEGTLTLWRGLSPTLVMAIPANVIYFTGYDWLRYNHMSPIRAMSNDTYNPLISGSCARVMAALVVSPIEMFRTRMQSTAAGTTSVFKDTWTEMKTMTKTQGITSLWRGLTLTMWRDVPFSALYWWGYETTRNKIRNIRGEGVSNAIPTVLQQQQQATESHSRVFIDSFLAGSISGAVAAFVTTPFDVGKTRQQVYRHAGDDAPSAALAAKEAAKTGKFVPEELSMPRFLTHILREEGLRGFFTGWAARCLKVAPACAIMISSYEMGKQWAKTHNTNKEDETQGQEI